MNNTINDFELNLESECQHFRQKFSKGLDNLSISFCVECGLIFVTHYEKEDQRTFYISPYDVWKLFNYKFNVVE